MSIISEEMLLNEHNTHQNIEVFTSKLRMLLIIHMYS